VKCGRIVMCFVVRAVKQGYRSFPPGLNNWPPPIWICLKFREIPAAEFTPLGWITERVNEFETGSVRV
jgi:hypothetical protein